MQSLFVAKPMRWFMPPARRATSAAPLPSWRPQALSAISSAAVLRIGNYLIVSAVVLVTLTLVVSVARGNPLLQTLEFALVVTIASIPVALPAVLSVTMAVGARQLAHRQAVVSHLPAVEETWRDRHVVL